MKWGQPTWFFFHSFAEKVNKDFYRPAEVELLYGNADPAREQLGWKPEISFDKLVQRMVECDLELEHAKR